MRIGTGVAPIRSMVFDRIHQGAAGKTRRYSHEIDHLLFLGFRGHQLDYYYQADWEWIQRQGKGNVHVAFSRDQVPIDVY
jgi:sulfite reductase alpha subunit-like flavoprotein